MTRRIGVLQRVVEYIAIAVACLRVGPINADSVRAQKAAQRGIVVAGIVEQQARARIFALASVVELGAAHAAGAHRAPRVECLRCHQCAGHAAAGCAHRTQVIAVDVHEAAGVTAGGGARGGAGGHAIVGDHRAIGTVFDQPTAHIARRGGAAALTCWNILDRRFLYPLIVGVVDVGFGGGAAHNLGRLVFNVPGIGASAAARQIAVRVVGVRLAADARHRVGTDTIGRVGIGHTRFRREVADKIIGVGLVR